MDCSAQAKFPLHARQCSFCRFARQPKHFAIFRVSSFNQALQIHFSMLFVCWACALAAAPPVPVDQDYNQWKQALGTNVATTAAHITASPGFRVELVRSAMAEEGSWVALAFDPRGRIVIAREDRGLLRLTVGSNAPARVEMINTNLLECRGLLFAHGALYANANNSKGLYRLRDLDGNDQFEDVQLLKATPGGVGHGRNQLALGPDGMIYSIHGDDVGLPREGLSTNSPLRHYAEDRLLPCEWDKHLFNASAKMPFGHLVRTDREGRSWELVAGGMRNPFGLDFNPRGDLFTFDADMEWDAGMPWYHPTRVLHLVPGGDYGWRRGTGVLAVWSADTLPSVVDVGLGSPTAVKFGTRSNFPEPWRSALYILDWAYGKIHAVHLEASGATYTGRAEVFLQGRPLNVTGIDFGPDGAMYFTTGGRRTQSGLYRVWWSGSHTEMPPSKETPQAVRRATDLWSALDSADAWERYAARVELETRPVNEWRERALREKRPAAALTALLALVRSGEQHLQRSILDRAHELMLQPLPAEQELIGLRTLAVCFIRMGKPDGQAAQRFNKLLEPRYAGADTRVNQSLCELLVYLESTNMVSKTLNLIDRAATQEEKLHYLFNLRLVKSGWTLEDRRHYFTWLARARLDFHGARMLPTALNYIRADAEATLSSADRSALADVLAVLDKPATPAPPPPVQRPFVKQWTMADVDQFTTAQGNRDRNRGQRLFTEIGCAQCHRVGNIGGVAGPELTAVGSRFDRRTLFESIIEPSRVIADVYRTVTITTKSGAIYDGRTVAENENTVTLAVNPVDPDHQQRIARSDIVSRRISDISAMPQDLLNSLTRDEILDLLGWLEEPK
jgi:putative heme-binding domain-containing protein